MLYQTQHPFTYPSNPCSSSYKFALRLFQNMECKLNQQSQYLEDFDSPQTSTTPASVEDFFVDQLLNLNDDDLHQHEEDDDSPCLSPPPLNSVVVVKEEHYEALYSAPCLDSVLSVPPEEADLEWLSHFVEESFSHFSTPYPPAFPKPNQPSDPPSGKSKRSKRARTGGRVWSVACSDPSSPSSSSPETAPSKKLKNKEAGPSGGGFPKRCSHCGVHKTPQWRTGPEGAKTLCNACGVRYKSGRLLPEYRPACSPTFSTHLHSNSHRKVLEMRKKKETGQPDSGGLHYPLSSFG